MIYLLLSVIIILQRLVELFVAKRNESWMLKKGGKVIEEGHYRWIVLTHIVFFIFLLGEAFIRHEFSAPIIPLFLLLFVAVQLARVWCLFSLGKFWNTKIVVLPNASLIRKGPYKYIRHPNYWIVGAEMYIIPLLFHAYFTALLFPIVHLVLMSYRIPMEEQALKKWSKWEKV